jgi:hypothetical protein
LSLVGKEAFLSLERNKKISDWNYLVLPCVKNLLRFLMPCAVEIGCDVFRTKLSLPKTLTNLDSHIIEYVMSVENSHG